MADDNNDGAGALFGVVDLILVTGLLVVIVLIIRKFTSKKTTDEQLKNLQINPV